MDLSKAYEIIKQRSVCDLCLDVENGHEACIECENSAVIDYAELKEAYGVVLGCVEKAVKVQNGVEDNV